MYEGQFSKLSDGGLIFGLKETPETPLIVSSES